MINPKAKLVPNFLDAATLEMKPTRDGFGAGLVEIGSLDPRVVVLCADLMESTRCHWFAEKFPDRFIEMGVAEQNLATVGSGMATYGKIPFIASYATFSPGRNNEQIRTTISLNYVPVKIAGAHAGVSVGPDGATHQALEDIALMRVQPNMTVVVPCDSVETHKATVASVTEVPGPAYLRFGREKSAVFTTKDTPFKVGRAEIFRLGNDVAVIGCGMLIYNALVAAEQLAKDGLEVQVINCHTVKPLDIKTICRAALETGAVVTVEEHQVAGGLGSAVAEALALNQPVPMEFIGIHDRFGESGEPDQLIKAFGMDADSIKKAILKVYKRKK
ncbi:transketolase family protein [Candidatus Uhrbacteria bacterium]|nr:transketolase family protein [Candidatus Uhrbacteria bacterium]